MLDFTKFQILASKKFQLINSLAHTYSVVTNGNNWPMLYCNLLTVVVHISLDELQRLLLCVFLLLDICQLTASKSSRRAGQCVN